MFSFHLKLKNSSHLIGNIIQSAKGYAVAKKIPITWAPPEKISCIDPRRSGDGGLDVKVDENEFICGFEKSKELENADDIVKKVFSVGFNKRKELAKLRKEKFMDMVKAHSYDKGSWEANIAQMTARILHLQEHQKNFPYNGKSKNFLKELIEKRKKRLTQLRRTDYRLFEFVLERLNLVYKPFPRLNPYIYRKASTKHKLENYCDDMIAQKLENYRKELESQHKSFFKEKAEKLEFIRNEELALGVEPTVTEEEVEEAKKKAASYEKVEEEKGKAAK